MHKILAQDRPSPRDIGRTVAVEVARHGITCNALCPATVLTLAIEGRIEALIDGGWIASRPWAPRTVQELIGEILH